MKKWSVLVSFILLAALLAGCGGTAPETGGYGSSAVYADVIEAARPAELNEAGFYTIVTENSDADLLSRLFYETSPFSQADMLRYAISTPGIITLAYGVAIILPTPENEQAVLDAVNAFVEQNKKAQENYLQDQYEIADSAIVAVAESGEVLLVMCQNAEAVMAAIKTGLAAAPLASRSAA
jgi:hypothetical protein